MIDDAAGRDPRRLHAGRGRHPDLQRLPVRAERRAQPARLEQRQPLGRARALVVEPEQPRGDVRGRRGAAHRGRVPAAVVQPVRAAEATHRLEAGRVRRQRVADAAVERGRHRDRRRRGGRAQVRDAGQVGVVEVEHVPGGAQPRDALEQAVAGRARGLRRPLLAAAVRARQPVEQRRPVSGHRTATRHTHAISTPCSGSRATQQRPRDRAEALRVDGHVHVGREDRQQRGDQPPAGGAARALRQHARSAGDLGDAARVHDLALAREHARHDRDVRRRLEEVQQAGEQEEAAEQEVPDHGAYGCTNRRALRSVGAPAKPCGRPPCASR